MDGVRPWVISLKKLSKVLRGRVDIEPLKVTRQTDLMAPMVTNTIILFFSKVLNVFGRKQIGCHCVSDICPLFYISVFHFVTKQSIDLAFTMHTVKTSVYLILKIAERLGELFISPKSWRIRKQWVLKIKSKHGNIRTFVKVNKKLFTFDFDASTKNNLNSKFTARKTTNVKGVTPMSNFEKIVFFFRWKCNLGIQKQNAKGLVPKKYFISKVTAFGVERLRGRIGRL